MSSNRLTKVKKEIKIRCAHHGVVLAPAVVDSLAMLMLELQWKFVAHARRYLDQEGFGLPKEN